jgi:hypothetical protein
MRKLNFLHLTGGLGNQLFQLAAGLNFSSDKVLRISVRNGKPRLNSSGEPELFSFKMPHNVMVIEEQRYSKFVSKVFGYMIRMSANPSRFENIWFVNFSMRILASFVASCYFRSFITIRKASGVGYVGGERNGNLFIGYFQTFKYAESAEVFELLRNIEIRDRGPQFNALVDSISSENPIVVHLRRGDYVNENRFGLIGIDYYLEAIKELLKSDAYSSIWVFSDDLDEAKRLFAGQFTIRCVYVGDVDGSSASALELMRHGKAFVIGNSSFSWWGAYLRYNSSAQVFAPTPWFSGLIEPEHLIPNDWIRRNGRHSSDSPLELECE